jgi:ankyrin repeat protein
MISRKAMLRWTTKQVTLLITLLLWGVSTSTFANTGLELVEAARDQDWALMQNLLNEEGIDVNTMEADGTTALALAVYRNHRETVKALLDAGADPDLVNVYGVSPLSLAMENHSVGMVELLLDGGADPNATSWSGESVLMTAAWAGLIEAMELLIDHGADINYQDPRRHQSALMWAISFGHLDAMRLLIDHGADVNASTIQLNEEFTPMEIEGYEGSTISGVPMGGYTPLLFAARVGDLDSARLLVEHGANVNATSNSDGDPLIMAASQGYEDLAIYFLEQGADPNVTDRNGMSALHYALRDGIKVLHGRIIIDKNMVCNFGDESFLCKPYEILNEEQREYMKHPDTNLYTVEADSGSKYSYTGDKLMPGHNMHRLVGELLARGADPNAQMKHPPASYRLDVNTWFALQNATPFFLAAAAQDEAAVAMLLEHGAKPLITTNMKNQLFEMQVRIPAGDNMVIGNATTLMAAVGIGRRSDMSFDEEENALKIARRLVSMGADVNAATVTGWTALHAAAFMGANKLIRFLVEHGAEINVMNGCGLTPMGLALANDSTGLLDRTLPKPATAETLLELGAGLVPPPGPVGECIHGRGGLEADDSYFRPKVKERLVPVIAELERRKANWPK